MQRSPPHTSYPSVYLVVVTVSICRIDDETIESIASFNTTFGIYEDHKHPQDLQGLLEALNCTIVLYISIYCNDGIYVCEFRKDDGEDDTFIG